MLPALNASKSDEETTQSSSNYMCSTMDIGEET